MRVAVLGMPDFGRLVVRSIVGFCLLVSALMAQTTFSRADDDAALCEAVQGLATATNQVMAGKTMSVPGIVFDNFSVDCNKRILSFEESVPLVRDKAPDYVWRVAQVEADNSFCKSPIGRGFVDKGWRIEMTTRFTDGRRHRLAVDCTGIPEPRSATSPVRGQLSPRAVPLDEPGVVDRSQTPTSASQSAPAFQPAVPEAAKTAPGMQVQTLRPIVDPAGNPVIVYETTGLNPDCSRTGALTFRIVKPPAHGRLRVVSASIFPQYPPSNVRSACNSRAVPGYRITYAGRRGYSGTDSAEFDVFWPAGAAVDLTAPIEVR